MLQQSRGIVLHTLKYNDDALIAHVLTATSGTVTFMVRIAHSRRKSPVHTLFQPLALLDICWEEHPRSSMQRPKSATVAAPLMNIPYDMHKRGITMYLAEFLHHALHAEPASETLFDYIYHSILWLDAAQRGIANFHLIFLLRLTRFLGLFPEVAEVRPGMYFDLENCAFCLLPPQHPHYLQPDEAARLPVLLRLRYESMHLVPMTSTERNRFLDLIGDYYRLHCPGFPHLKSLDVLREVFR